MIPTTQNDQQPEQEPFVSDPSASGVGESVQKPARGIAAEIWDWTKSIAIALIIVSILHFFVFNLSTVKGQSMQPTLYENEWLFVNKIGYLLGKPDRGDVVILKDPEPQLKDHEFLVKRVVAVPGDKVEIRDHRLYINDQRQTEGYTDVEIEGQDYGPEIMPEGHYFVMGDNRHLGESKDSREFGPVPADLIKGHANFILWPIGKMGGL